MLRPHREALWQGRFPKRYIVALVNTTFLDKDKIIGYVQQLGTHSFS